MAGGNRVAVAQVKKIHRRRKLVKVERNMLCGELTSLRAHLQTLGLSGNINTAFIERLNLTIRQGVSFLVRRIWGTAQFTPELALHLEWWRAYYHFSRYHESLRVQFPELVRREGEQHLRRYRRAFLNYQPRIRAVPRGKVSIVSTMRMPDNPNSIRIHIIKHT